ncbi:MAG: TonB family protein [Cytophagales bacterium]|nr:TonB family protein [Cytophagales bacterium]
MKTSFTFKRTYLLTSIIASLLFPLFTIQTSTSLIPTLSKTVPVQWLPEVVVYADGTTTAIITTTQYWSWLSIIYVLISIVAMVFFIIRIISIIRLFANSQHYSWKHYTIVESQKVNGVFSFFTYIFFSPKQKLSTEEKTEILRHEEVHIQRLHSIDILLIQLLGIVFWFNPIIRSYKKSLVQVHEFEADARSVEGHDVDAYCSLLAKVALQNNGYVLANHFTNSFTLKRIEMMKTVRTNIKNWKVLATALTLPLFFFVVACQDQVADIQEIGKNSSMALEYPIEVQTELEKMKIETPNSEFIVVEMNSNGRQIMEKLESERTPENDILKMSVISAVGHENKFVIIAQGKDADMLINITKSEDEVFTIVEESAQPEGGITQYFAFVADNLKYPKEAKDKKIQGRVMAEFVVDTDGTLSDIKIVKGIGYGCDEEALRVLNLNYNWVPGKQRGKAVKQKLVIPIAFALVKEAFPAASSITPVNDKHMSVVGSIITENGVKYMQGQASDKSGNPLPGINVVIASTTQGTVTDVNGLYKLKLNQSTGKLVFSFIGYETSELNF